MFQHNETQAGNFGRTIASNRSYHPVSSKHLVHVIHLLLDPGVAKTELRSTSSAKTAYASAALLLHIGFVSFFHDAFFHLHSKQ